jgi:hypothetical protein
MMMMSLHQHLRSHFAKFDEKGGSRSFLCILMFCGHAANFRVTTPEPGLWILIIIFAPCVPDHEYVGFCKGRKALPSRVP